VKLVTRYVVREHVGPLVFALSALTSLLMLQYVARQLANLAGKGLPWSAIVKFFLLSLPFTIAMTLPMAVLVATLFAFGRMAAENEITAFKANGVRVRTLMLPVLSAPHGVGRLVADDRSCRGIITSCASCSRTSRGRSRRWPAIRP
jgi:lipopolysaccharide export system permease protein